MILWLCASGNRANRNLPTGPALYPGSGGDICA
jgi:hypothetical protein